MKAEALPEVYDIFDPQEPLSGEKLREYYVNRESPVERLSGILKITKKIQHNSLIHYTLNENY